MRGHAINQKIDSTIPSSSNAGSIVATYNHTVQQTVHEDFNDKLRSTASNGLPTACYP